MPAHTAADFARGYSSRTFLDYRALLGTIVRYSPPGEILDLGAGEGHFVECCGRWGVPAVGLEAAAGVQSAATRGVALLEGDLADSLPFEDARFAAAVLNQVIEHLHPATARHVLREARRVIQPGGRIFLFAPTMYRRAGWREPTHVNMRMMSPRRIRRELEAAGFSNVQSLAFGASGLGLRAGRIAHIMDPLPGSVSCMAATEL